MKRGLFNLAAAISTALCVGSLLLWICAAVADWDDYLHESGPMRYRITFMKDRIVGHVSSNANRDYEDNMCWDGACSRPTAIFPGLWFDYTRAQPFGVYLGVAIAYAAIAIPMAILPAWKAAIYVYKRRSIRPKGFFAIQPKEESISN